MLHKNSCSCNEVIFIPIVKAKCTFTCLVVCNTLHGLYNIHILIHLSVSLKARNAAFASHINASLTLNKGYTVLIIV